ncbi:unnamed protein product [Polarella glacialis]|uniref:Uncharacterized protein n=1 Tax=Polarella glacialis TaxID=89957 RepID=A0A813ED87_POLGL|nr:unnamed protein product [Polarella glacialis]|mmetsp:Transcript_100566/g.181529  ORF Transcript_100566/g.181529 Transcript_100566/m.181529 type:complete len:129 (+) Transcript_100566:150-536(+)|eukprot:CAMPEP_0115131646 /NCGR_PEP_ID=MMETSP0227-20121206/53249_1 /TAXON_ID=89957 /ORGANISM="Polarella glacialis, Strain CCMP 1383" /LENGTH=128 /DNA_ID=CAMNT_0002537223 /DNA_START=73 /DNA_END=459 /DNA_ORIENTATION=-
MGATVCSSCGPDDGGDPKQISPPGELMMQEQARLAEVLPQKKIVAPAPSLWEQTEGLWRREEDAVFMGKISKELIQWASEFEAEPSKLSQVEAKTISMNVGDGSEDHFGIFEAPNKLTWSDGEVWVKD